MSTTAHELALRVDNAVQSPTAHRLIAIVRIAAFVAGLAHVYFIYTWLAHKGFECGDTGVQCQNIQGYFNRFWRNYAEGIGHVGVVLAVTFGRRWMIARCLSLVLMSPMIFMALQGLFNMLFVSNAPMSNVQVAEPSDGPGLIWTVLLLAVFLFFFRGAFLFALFYLFAPKRWIPSTLLGGAAKP